jgi:hypothetical protein
MRKGILYTVIFLVLLAAPTAVRYFSFYQLGSTERQEPPEYAAPEEDLVSIPESSDFVDEPEVGNGFVLLDQAHGNFFTLDEIGYLDGRLAARGHELRAYESGDLASALRSVKAFIVIAPQEPFSPGEVMAARNFVARGGRLLLIGDPTRFSVFIEEDLFTFTVDIISDKIPLNSLANEFDIIFNEDYLYNTRENEGNFRNIILQEGGLGENGFTDALNQIVFYGSHSLQVGPEGESVLLGDENTWSSDTDRPGGLTLAASSEEGRVLAVGDIHFLTAPYYTVHDNGAFIARIADFLTETERSYMLADFPYFYGNDINLVYVGSPDLGPDAFDEVITLQDAFRETGRNLSLRAEADSDADTLTLGLYNQAEDIMDLLASYGITLTIQPPIVAEEEMMATTEEETDDASGEEDAEVDRTEEDSSGTIDGSEGEEEDADQVRLLQSDLGNVQMSGTAVVLHHEDGDQHHVIVLAASNDGLEATIGRLLDLIPVNASYALADCLLQANLALCPTGIADEAVEAELETGGTPDRPVDEEPTPEEEPEEPEGPEGEGPEGVDQGTIGLDETVEGTLDSGEAHLWTFSDGPAAVNIIVEGSDDVDAVLELFGPDNELIDSADSTFSGDAEEILNIELDEGDYTIRISDFFDDGGAYTLTVAPAGTAEGDGDEDAAGIFIFGDDDGTPLTSGFTSVETLAAMLGEDYEVTTWLTSVDGPLEADTLEGSALVIWDSGDYRNEDGLLDDDTAVILDYLGAGGKLIIVGASPTLLGALELASLADVEVVGDHPVLLDGLAEGDVIELDQAYDAVLLDPLDSDLNENDIVFLVRGPGSNESGGLIGIASIEEDFGNTQVAILLFPFTALPTDIQETLLTNLMNWMDFT